MTDITPFQNAALNKIRHVGGSIFYATNKSWTDKHGVRLTVPAADFRTEGFIGWPTIKALVAAERLTLRGGNEYAITNRT